MLCLCSFVFFLVIIFGKHQFKLVERNHPEILFIFSIFTENLMEMGFPLGFVLRIVFWSKKEQRSKSNQKQMVIIILVGNSKSFTNPLQVNEIILKFCIVRTPEEVFYMQCKCVRNQDTTDLITRTVFDAISAGRQSGQKLPCLHGNLMTNNFSKIELNTICNQNFKILGRRLYSPSLKDVAWFEDTQLTLVIFHKFVCNFVPAVNVNLPLPNFTDKWIEN